jgi:alkylation response protein AidB-like acyl-CoA dehydrogenase
MVSPDPVTTIDAWRDGVRASGEPAGGRAGGRHWADDPMIGAVRGLGPAIRSAADRIEAERCLPEDLVATLTDARVFQMYLPRSVGGPEVHPLTGMAVVEELARHDGSVGWCAQVAAATTVFLAWLDPDAVAEMVATTPAPLHIAGSARPLGTAVRTGGGYRVSGRWNFASGVRHANWFLASAFVDGASPRSMLVPIGSGEIVANWDVMGMRGTGSDDYVLDGVEVPRARIAARHWIEARTEPLYDPALNMVATWAPTAGVGLGLARGAIDALIDLGERASAGSAAPLRDRPPVQAAIGEAEAIAGAARAFCVETIEELWEARLAGADRDALARPVARAQLAITHSLNEAVRVADLCFHAAGTNAASAANRLERFLRDAHTAVLHAAGQPVHRQVAGRVLLGLDPGALDPTRVGPTTQRS